jgi:hypothetical protein
MTLRTAARRTPLRGSANSEWHLEALRLPNFPALAPTRASRLHDWRASLSGDPSGAAFLQRGRDLLALHFGSTPFWSEPETLTQTELEFLAPFDGFDPWTSIDAGPDCSVFAVGIGLFPPNAGVVPRSLVLLERGKDAGTFTAHRLATRAPPTSIAAVETSSGQTVLGILSIDGSSHEASFEVMKQTGCRQWESDLYQEGLPIAVRIVNKDAPRGVVLVATSPTATSSRFALYDGFTLHLLDAGMDGSFSHSSIRFHDTREDTIWSEPH